MKIFWKIICGVLLIGYIYLAAWIGIEKLPADEWWTLPTYFLLILFGLVLFGLYFGILTNLIGNKNR